MPLSEPQREIYTDPTRFRVLVSGRRFGKSVLILNELIRAAQTGSDLDVYYVAPYLKMAKGIMWKMLKQAIPPANIAEKNEQELRITLKGYNSTIHLHGADNIDSLRGISISFLAVDEIQDVPIELIDTVLRPAMGDQMADGLYCGTPKGKGENTAYKLYMRGKTKPDWKSWIFTTANGGNVPQEEIDAAKAVMSPKQFAQEYEASFITMLGRVYYAFSVDENVSDAIEDNGSTIHIGMDFNVGKMCACVGNIVDGKLHIFDEIVLIDSNTREMCNEINSRYPNRDIIVYPDPAGKSRSTKSDSGVTDHSIIKNEFKFQLLAKNSHPKIVDRINNVNSMLLSASGERKLLINPRCTEVINSLDGQAYKEGTSLPDKESGLDHMCFSGDTKVEVRGCGVISFKDIPKSGFVRNAFGEWVEYQDGGIIKEGSSFIELCLSDNTTIKCTPDHKFLTLDGWLEAKDLVGRELVTCNTLEKFQAQYKNFLGYDTTCVENTTKIQEKGYTDLCMRCATEKSQKDFMSTTKTEIGQTTSQKILSCLVRPYISLTTAKKGQKTPLKGLKRISSTYKRNIESGEKLRKPYSGHKNTTTKTKINCIKKLYSLVSTVKRNMLALFLEQKAICSVQNPAKQDLDFYLGLMTRQELAKFVQTVLKLTNIPKNVLAPACVSVSSIREIEKQTSYCLTTKTGSFVLPNGIVVSNCDSLGYLVDYRFSLLKREVKKLELDWSY